MHDTELALLIDRLMRRIHFGLQSKAHQFDTERVGPGGGIILLTLAEMGTPSMQELTQRVARDKSQMTRSIRSLEAKGLVTRHPSQKDARASLVQLTGEGEIVVKALHAAVASTIDEILEPISAEDKNTLRSLLERALCEI